MLQYHRLVQITKSNRVLENEQDLTYFPSLCLGLGREYFRYPSQGTFFKPARTDMMPRTLHKSNV